MVTLWEFDSPRPHKFNRLGEMGSVRGLIAALKGDEEHQRVPGAARGPSV